MKNKKVKLGILVLAAVILFTATAFASTPGNEGYEALKQIMMDQQELKAICNATIDGSFQVQDNGRIIAEAVGKVKGNHEAGEASGNVTVKLMDKEQELSFFRSNGASYLVDETNARYYQLVNTTGEFDRSQRKISRGDFAGSHHMGKAGEALLDYFVGDLKSQFSLSNNVDGTRSITLDLNGNEIPAPINLLVGAAVENKNGYSDKQYESRMDPAQKEQLIEKLPFLKEFTVTEKDMPRLKTDVKLEGIFVKLIVDETNKVKSFEVKIKITGKDANGAAHEIIFLGSASISDLNNTTVDSFNPDGKSIETLDMKEFKDNQ